MVLIRGIVVPDYPTDYPQDERQDERMGIRSRSFWTVDTSNPWIIPKYHCTESTQRIAIVRR